MRVFLFFFSGQAHSTHAVTFEDRFYKGRHRSAKYSNLKLSLNLFLQSASLSEEVILLMADILAVLASSENGRKHLLFGEKNNHSDE